MASAPVERGLLSACGVPGAVVVHAFPARRFLLTSQRFILRAHSTPASLDLFQGK